MKGDSNLNTEWKLKGYEANGLGYKVEIVVVHLFRGIWIGGHIKRINAGVSSETAGPSLLSSILV